MTGTGCCWPGTGGAVPRDRVGAADPGGQVRHRRVDPGESRAVDAAQGPGSAARAGAVPGPGGALPRPGHPHSGGSVPVWHGPGGPATVAPVFLLYDYTFRPDGALTKEQGLTMAYEKGIVSRDEALLTPTRTRAGRMVLGPDRGHRAPARRAGPGAPGRVRLALSAGPRAHPGPALPAVCAVVRHHATSDWHLRFNAAAVVYGHLHIRGSPGTTASGSRRSRSATRVNGGAATSRRASRGRSCPPHRPRTPPSRPDLSQVGPQDQFAGLGVVFEQLAVAAPVDGDVELAAGLVGGEAAAQQVQEEPSRSVPSSVARSARRSRLISGAWAAARCRTGSCWCRCRRRRSRGRAR